MHTTVSKSLCTDERVYVGDIDNRQDYHVTNIPTVRGSKAMYRKKRAASDLTKAYTE